MKQPNLFPLLPCQTPRIFSIPKLSTPTHNVVLVLSRKLPLFLFLLPSKAPSAPLQSLLSYRIPSEKKPFCSSFSKRSPFTPKQLPKSSSKSLTVVHGNLSLHQKLSFSPLSLAACPQAILQKNHRNLSLSPSPRNLLPKLPKLPSFLQLATSPKSTQQKLRPPPKIPATFLFSAISLFSYGFAPPTIPAATSSTTTLCM